MNSNLQRPNEALPMTFHSSKIQLPRLKVPRWSIKVQSVLVLKVL